MRTTAIEATKTHLFTSGFLAYPAPLNPALNKRKASQTSKVCRSRPMLLQQRGTRPDRPTALASSCPIQRSKSPWEVGVLSIVLSSPLVVNAAFSKNSHLFSPSSTSQAPQVI